MWDSDYQDLLAQSHRYLAWLSTLTLGQIFTAVYNPPTKLNLTLLVIAICFKVPEWAYRLSQWRLSRRAQRFEWPKPEVSAAVSTDFGSSEEGRKRWVIDAEAVSPPSRAYR
jgi:hypothetical protein